MSKGVGSKGRVSFLGPDAHMGPRLQACLCHRYKTSSRFDRQARARATPNRGDGQLGAWHDKGEGVPSDSKSCDLPSPPCTCPTAAEYPDRLH